MASRLRSTLFILRASLVEIGRQGNSLLKSHKITVRNYSTSDNNSVSTPKPVVSVVKVYDNMDLDKFNVVKDNKGKSGVYRMTNLTNNKTYIGSSINIGHRFTTYYSIKRLESLKPSTICKALIKYGYSGFKLEILEYCAPEKCIEREQYYFDTLNPEELRSLKDGRFTFRIYTFRRNLE